MGSEDLYRIKGVNVLENVLLYLKLLYLKNGWLSGNKTDLKYVPILMRHFVTFPHNFRNFRPIDKILPGMCS